MISVAERTSEFEAYQTNTMKTGAILRSTEYATFARAQQHRQELQAFEEMLLTSRPTFIAMAYGILRNKEDAEDAVQNAFLSAYLHLRAFEGRSALRTWFTRIVLNAALMIRRKRKPSRLAPVAEPWTEQIPASGPDPEKICADNETLQRIDAELANMRPALRQAFAMTYYGEMSNREACALLGVPIGTFKARLFRARKLVVSHPRVARDGKRSELSTKALEDQGVAA
jgi:RNA polymerase sigma-70 factor (ECF subfamily)